MFTGKLRVSSVVFAVTVAAFVASGVSHGAKPPPTPPLNAGVCKGIGGVWTHDTCTIPEGTCPDVSSGFKIGRGDRLDVKGCLTIKPGVTIANSGTIIVENGASGMRAGILVLGILDNSGAITIQNVTDSTEGIAISAVLSDNVPPVPLPLLIAPGVVTNSGTITIQNTGQTQGINNDWGVLNNATSGTIMVVNSVANSVGIRNERISTITNAGSIAIVNSGDAGGRGISNAGSFTNSATGTFTINPSGVQDDAALGFRNNGSFTNYGTFTNNRGTLNESDPINSTWGSYNLEPGSMMNYGKTYVGTPAGARGTFYNEFIMLNLGEITSYGVLADTTGLMMINFGTLYNYGQIFGGNNKGICIDEILANPNAFGC